MDRYFEVSPETPFWDDVVAGYDASKERIRDSDYQVDLQLDRLKRSP